MFGFVYFLFVYLLSRLFVESFSASLTYGTGQIRNFQINPEVTLGAKVAQPQPYLSFFAG